MTGEVFCENEQQLFSFLALNSSLSFSLAAQLSINTLVDINTLNSDWLKFA